MGCGGSKPEETKPAASGTPGTPGAAQAQTSEVDKDQAAAEIQMSAAMFIQQKNEGEKKDQAAADIQKQAQDFLKAKAAAPPPPTKKLDTENKGFLDSVAQLSHRIF